MTTLTMQDFIASADKYSTDEFVLKAIAEVAEDVDDAQQIWVDGLAEVDENTRHHFLSIATKNGVNKASDIRWGDGTLRDVLDILRNAHEYADW